MRGHHPLPGEAGKRSGKLLAALVEWQDAVGDHLPALEAMAKHGRRVSILERRPRMTGLARDVLGIWSIAKHSRRIGFGGAEGLDPAAVLACIDGCEAAGAQSRGTLLRLVLEHDARWLAAARARREAKGDG